MSCVDQCDEGYYEDGKYCRDCLQICDNKADVIMDPLEYDVFPVNGIFMEENFKKVEAQMIQKGLKGYHAHY